MKKETWITLISIVFLIAFVYFGTPLFAPRIETTEEVQPFWVVEASPEHLTVFKLTLDQSTLSEAQQILGNRITLSLFDSEGVISLEGYFRETRVGPFTGRVPFTLNASQEELRAYADSLEAPKRTQSNNTWRYKIPVDELEKFNTYTLHSLAFIPMSLTLTATDIAGRFGQAKYIINEPAEREKEAVTHYLYPERGIDVAIDKQGRALIQYLTPKYFDTEVLAPLNHRTNKK